MRRSELLFMPVAVLMVAGLALAQGEKPPREPGTEVAGERAAPAPFDVASFLKEHDRDKDGRLSRISREEARGQEPRSFAHLDKDGDGFLTREELTEAASATSREGRAPAWRIVPSSRVNARGSLQNSRVAFQCATTFLLRRQQHENDDCCGPGGGGGLVAGQARAQHYRPPYHGPGPEQLVASWYERFLHRRPDPQAAVWAQQLQSGLTPEEVLAQILGSSEYYLGPAGGTNQGFTRRLYLDLAGRPPGSRELEYVARQLYFRDRTDVAYQLLARYPQAWRGEVTVGPTTSTPGPSTAMTADAISTGAGIFGPLPPPSYRLTPDCCQLPDSRLAVEPLLRSDPGNRVPKRRKGNRAGFVTPGSAPAPFPGRACAASVGGTR